MSRNTNKQNDFFFTSKSFREPEAFVLYPLHDPFKFRNFHS
jgi:hypothetical protein